MSIPQRHADAQLEYIKILLPDDYEICGPGEIQNIIAGSEYQQHNDGLQISFFDAIQAIAAAITIFQAAHYVVMKYKREADGDETKVSRQDIDAVRSDPQRRDEIISRARVAAKSSQSAQALPADVSEQEAADLALKMLGARL